MTPTVIKSSKANRASGADALWLKGTLNREGINFGTSVRLENDGILNLFRA